MKPFQARHAILLRLSAVMLGLLLACEWMAWVQQPTPVIPGTPGVASQPSRTATPPAQPTTAADWVTQRGTRVSVSVTYPKGWIWTETGDRIVIAMNADTLAGAELEGPALVISRSDKPIAPDDLLALVKLQPSEIKQRESATLGGEAARLVQAQVISPTSARGYRLLILAARHADSAYLVTASAPLEQWDRNASDLQAMIKSIAF